MNIASLQVSIDPSGAISGAAQSVAASTTVITAFRQIRAAQNAMNTGSGRGPFGRMASEAQASASTIQRVFGTTFRTITGGARAMANALVFGFNSIRSAISSTMSGLATFGLAINGLRTLMAPFTNAARTAFAFIKDSVGTAAGLESTEAAMRGLLSSATKAQQMMADLRKTALTTPFEFPELADAARQLLSYGEAAETVITTIRRLGDLSALTGGKSTIGDIAYLYGTARQQAHLFARDINQFSERGIPVLEALSLTLKKSKTEIMDMVTKGKIGFKDLEKAVESMTNKGGPAFGQMAQQMETWKGKMSNLADAWTFVENAIGKPIIDGLKPLLDDLQGLTLDVAKQIEGMYPAIRQVVDYIPAAFRVMREEGGLKLAFEAATDFLGQTLRRLWETTKIILGAVFQNIAINFTNALKVLASPKFWAGVGDALVSGVTAAMKALAEGPGGIAKREYESQVQNDYARKQLAALQSQVESAKGRQSNNYAEFGGSETVTGFEQYQRDVSVIADFTKNQEAINKQFPGGSMANELFPEDWNKNGGVPIPGWSEAWETTVKEPTEAMSMFGDAVMNVVKIIRGERAVKDAANLLTGSEQEAAAAARKDALNKYNAPGATVDKSAATKAAREAAKLDRMYQKYAENADPQAELDRKLRDIQKLSDAGKLSAEERIMMEHKAQEEYALDMKKRVDETRKAAVAMATPLQKLAAQWGDLRHNAQQASVAIAESFASNITNAFTDMISGTKSVAQAFADMAQGIIRDILSIITKLLVQYAISKAISGLAGGGGGFLGFASKAVTGGVFHDGGEVGGPAPQRAMSPSMLTSARRYHSGGVAGLSPGEVPAILQRGEHVSTRKQASDQKRRMMGKDKPATAKQTGSTIINLFDPQQVPAMLAQNPGAILNVIAMNKSTVRRVLS